MYEFNLLEIEINIIVSDIITIVTMNWQQHGRSQGAVGQGRIIQCKPTTHIAT